MATLAPHSLQAREQGWEHPLWERRVQALELRQQEHVLAGASTQLELHDMSKEVERRLQAVEHCHDEHASALCEVELALKMLFQEVGRAQQAVRELQSGAGSGQRAPQSAADAVQEDETRQHARPLLPQHAGTAAAAEGIAAPGASSFALPAAVPAVPAVPTHQQAPAGGERPLCIGCYSFPCKDAAWAFVQHAKQTLLNNPVGPGHPLFR